MLDRRPPARLEHDVLLARRRDRQLQADRRGQPRRPRARRDDDVVGLDQLAADSDTAAGHDRLDRRFLAHLRPLPLRRDGIRARRGDGIREAGVRLEERVRDPVRRHAAEEL